MENKEKSILPPKGTDGRYKDIMLLHIQGLVLVLVLIIALASSFSILGRTIISMAMDSFGGSISSDDFSMVFDIYGLSFSICPCLLCHTASMAYSEAKAS